MRRNPLSPTSCYTGPVPVALFVGGNKKRTSVTNTTDSGTKITDSSEKQVTDNGSIVLAEGASFSITSTVDPDVIGGARDSGGGSFRDLIPLLADNRREAMPSAVSKLSTPAIIAMVAGVVILAVVVLRKR